MTASCVILGQRRRRSLTTAETVDVLMSRESRRTLGSPSCPVLREPLSIFRTANMNFLVSRDPQILATFKSAGNSPDSLSLAFIIILDPLTLLLVRHPFRQPFVDSSAVSAEFKLFRPPSRILSPPVTPPLPHNPLYHLKKCVDE